MEPMGKKNQVDLYRPTKRCQENCGLESEGIQFKMVKNPTKKYILFLLLVCKLVSYSTYIHCISLVYFTWYGLVLLLVCIKLRARLNSVGHNLQVLSYPKIWNKVRSTFVYAWLQEKILECEHLVFKLNTKFSIG